MKGKLGYQYAMGRVSNLPGLFFSSPIIDKEQIIGVAIVKVNLDLLSPMIQRNKAYLSDENGIVILADNKHLEMRTLPNSKINQIPIEKRIKRYKKGIFEPLLINNWKQTNISSLHTFNHELLPRMTVSQPIRKELTLHIAEPFAEIQPINNKRLQHFLVLSLSGILLLFILFWRIKHNRNRAMVDLKIANSERRLNLAQQIAHVGSFDWDIEGEKLRWSDEYFHLWGLEPKSINPSLESFYAGIHPEDLEQVELKLRQSLKGKIKYDHEHRIINPDGKIKYVHGVGEVLCDKKGIAKRMIGSVQDITLRITSEQKLRDSEARFRKLFETTDEISVQGYDKNRCVIYWNSASEKIYGYSAQQAIGNKLEDLIVPDKLKENVIADVDDWINGGKAIPSSELTLKHANGDAIQVYSNHIMLNNANGEAEMYCIDIDMTQFKQMESQVQKLAMAVEQNPHNIVITDVKGNIEYVNAAFVETTGYSYEEALGKNPKILQSHKTSSATYDDLWDKLKNGKAWKGEFINKKKSGEEYVEYSLIVPLQQKGGSISHYVALKENITEKKRIAKELDKHREHLEELVSERTLEVEKANKAKSEFLANMSHEIRTPMNSIIGLSQQILKTELNDKQRNFLMKVSLSAKNLLGIINDILDFSKIEAGKLELEELPMQLNQVIEQVSNIIELKCEEKDILLNINLDEKIPKTILGDSLRLSQILLNLSTNAVKFTPEHGQVTISVQALEETSNDILLQFIVNDTGIGITSEQQQSLFQSFSQADSSTTREFGGSGLGLAICKNLVELMAGKIELVSDVGQGSTFSFSIRFKKSKSENPINDEKLNHLSIEKSIQKLKGSSVLLVEDNEFNQILVEEILATYDINVVVSHNGQEALDRLSKEANYDCILMDCQMPVLDGYQTTYKIRQQAKFDKLPIIALTANVMKGDREKVLQSGMNDYIAKPIDEEVMLMTMAKWV